MVVTAKPTDMAEKVLSHVGIKDYFDCIIGAAREKKDSSKASLIEKAIEASGQTDKFGRLICDLCRRLANVMNPEKHYNCTVTVAILFWLVT